MQAGFAGLLRYVGRLRRPTSSGGVSGWYQNGEVGRLRRPTSWGVSVWEGVNAEVQPVQVSMIGSGTQHS